MSSSLLLIRFNFETLMNIDSIKNITIELLVVKKLPVLLRGKNSKNIIKKKGIETSLEFKSYFLLWR